LSSGLGYDPQIARLPHPYRFIASMEAQLAQAGLSLKGRPFYERVLGEKDYAGLVAELARTPLDWVASHNLCRDNPRMVAFFAELAGGRGATYGGNVTWLLDFTRWLHGGQHFFQSTKALDEALLATDIGPDIPVAFLRSPYPVLYLQFGEDLSTPLRVWNDVTADHVAEGCYILSGPAPEGVGVTRELPPVPGQRFIQFLFSGSPVGMAHNLDDATQALVVGLPDEDMTLVQALDRTFAAEEAAHRHRRPHDIDCMRRCAYHACTILLYLNTEAVQAAPVNEKSDLLARIARLKGGGKIAKLQRQAQRAYDRIVIGPRAPAPAIPPPTGLPSGRTVTSHFRRGHFRHQRIGEGRRASKLMWIAPVLVNPGAAVAQPKPYVIARPGEPSQGSSI
jgi:hypothetical protein